MRQNGIPPVFRNKWPIEINLDYPGLNESLLWSPWGVFGSKNIHCYTEDYRFESTWRNPELSLKRVLELNFVIAPDFSVYPESSTLVNSWQLYRSLAVFSYWQNMGVNVIPSINWISPEQILNDIDLYPDFNIIAVRCPGKKYISSWLAGASTIVNIVKPKLVLQFGTSLGSEAWKNCKIINYNLRPNFNTKKIDAKNNGNIVLK